MRAADRFYSMEHHRRVRQHALDFVLGAVVGLVLLVLMSAPWQ